MEHTDENYSNLVNNDTCKICHESFSLHVKDMTKPTFNFKVEIVDVDMNDEESDDDILSAAPLVEKEMQVFICHYCNTYFTKKCSLVTHIRRVHHNLFNGVLYDCHLCRDKTYSRRQDILVHMRVQHGINANFNVDFFARKWNISEVNEHLSKTLINTPFQLYECLPCAKQYIRTQDIVKHMRKVHNQIGMIDPDQYKIKVKLNNLDFPKYRKKTDEVFGCRPCKKKYNRSFDILVHMKQTHGVTVNAEEYLIYSEEKFGCQYCEQTFVSREMMRSHCQEEHSYRSHIYVCTECCQHFTFARNMSKHLLDAHDIVGDEAILRTISRKGHVKMAKSAKQFVYVCNICRKEYLSAVQMKVHLRNVHKCDEPDYKVQSKVNRVQFICHECHQTYLSKGGLTRHIEEAHATLEKKSPFCQSCQETFTNLDDLWSHILVSHKALSYDCTLCLVKLRSKTDIVRHMNSHHGILLKLRNSEMEDLKLKCRVYIDGALRYQCHLCQSILYSFSTLRTHMYTHTGEKPVVCDKCSKQFRTLSQLKVHTVSVHENFRRYGCEYCGHAFASSSNLAQHIRIHTGEKPYVCDLCGSRYAQSASLYSHKLTHEQNRCHVCNVCGRAFHRLPRLRQHMRIHTGDRPPRSHICDICKKGFRTGSEMRRHQEIHNQERSFVCETCGSAFKVRKYLNQHYKVHRNMSFGDLLPPNVTVETVNQL